MNTGLGSMLPSPFKELIPVFLRHKYRLIALAVVLLIGTARAETLLLPDSLLEIDDGAFQGCSKVTDVHIGTNVTSIGEDAFAGCAEDLLIHTSKGSTAARYAAAHNIDYQAGTVYRALIIGNSYAQFPSLRLQGPENDIIAMKACLVQYETTSYEVYVLSDIHADDMLGAIARIFGEATEEDVSLFYFSGHGILLGDASPQSALLGNDGESYVTSAALRGALDLVPGRKIILLDACYSGGFIEEKSSESTKLFRLRSDAPTISDDKAAEAFLNAFTAGFLTKGRRSQNNGSYYILASASANEKSYEDWIDGRCMGLFTAGLVEGCGWNAASGTSGYMAADSNSNGVITIHELFGYLNTYAPCAEQHIQAWPEGCRWFGILRL